MRDKNGVAMSSEGGVVDWDDYQKWLYSLPMPDDDTGPINLKEWANLLDD